LLEEESTQIMISREKIPTLNFLGQDGVNCLTIGATPIHLKDFQNNSQRPHSLAQIMFQSGVMSTKVTLVLVTSLHQWQL